MTSRMGAKGQVVVPKELRDQAGLHPGSDVDFTWDGERIVLVPVTARPQLAGRFANTGMAQRLLADRRSEPR